MIWSKMKLTESAATIVILLLAGVVVNTASYFFSPFNLPWIAWCALGYGAIFTLVGELIAVRDPSEGPVPGKIESAVNTTLTLLFSTPVLFVVVAVALTLLIVSVDTYGLLPTLASVAALYLLVIHALHAGKARPK